jgi:hypothetical protein
VDECNWDMMVYSVNSHCIHAWHGKLGKTNYE